MGTMYLTLLGFFTVRYLYQSGMKSDSEMLLIAEVLDGNLFNFLILLALTVLIFIGIGCLILYKLSKLAIIVSNPILLWLAGICKYKSCNHKIKSVEEDIGAPNEEEESKGLSSMVSDFSVSTAAANEYQG